MNNRALRAYGQKGLENEIDAASPHKLIAMLYDAALKFPEEFIALGERTQC